MLKVASDTVGGRLSIIAQPNRILKEISIHPNNNGQWQIIPISNIYLKKGKNILRFYAVKGGFDFKSFQLKRE
ncbi:MAG: hypothetical protein JWP81_5408 [Ferruginibacter sp.]|nr:hypothetical protein [Ferruginibacter sp.]